MITLVFSPRWFFGYDIIFELLAVIVTGIIGLYSFKLYYFSRQRSYRYFGFSFLAFAASLTVKIATNFVLYYQAAVKHAIADAIVKYNLLQKSTIFLETGYDLHRFLFLLGLFGVYWLISKSQDNEHRGILIYALFIIAIFSFSSYYVFHLTAAVLLFYILRHFHALCFRKRARINAQLNFLAFTLVFFSQIAFIFVFLSTTIYVVAEIIQLLGFVVFLINMLLLVFKKNGKTKD